MKVNKQISSEAYEITICNITCSTLFLIHFCTSSPTNGRKAILMLQDTWLHKHRKCSCSLLASSFSNRNLPLSSFSTLFLLPSHLSLFFIPSFHFPCNNFIHFFENVLHIKVISRSQQDRISSLRSSFSFGIV